MELADLLREARLDAALAELQQEVRRKPADPQLRTGLFQVLCLLGQWDRAANQLAVVGDLDAKALPMVQTYRTALECEVFRCQVFAGQRSPLLFGEPDGWIARMLEALRLSATGRHGDADRLRTEALDEAPASRGEIDGSHFEWIADADPRLGPMCEAIVNGKYYWIPFSRLRLVAIEQPADLRDCIWMPARLTFANGGEAVALLPTRYPGSEGQSDAGLRMARKTEWMQVSESTYVGLGQRMLATDAGEYPLMDTRRIAIDAQATSGESAA